jgi:hypothetical protein
LIEIDLDVCGADPQPSIEKVEQAAGVAMESKQHDGVVGSHYGSKISHELEKPEMPYSTTCEHWPENSRMNRDKQGSIRFGEDASQLAHSAYCMPRCGRRYPVKQLSAFQSQECTVSWKCMAYAEGGLAAHGKHDSSKYMVGADPFHSPHGSVAPDQYNDTFIAISPGNDSVSEEIACFSAIKSDVTQS